MLLSLTVSDFALVRALDIQFSPGLTVITGESGAGKSILLGALGLILGERASSDAIRPGAAKTDVSAEFNISNLIDTQNWLAEQELSDPDDANRCLVRRVVTSEGRSRAFINGAPATIALLRTLGESLVDIHGQGENYRLVQSQVQRGLLDDFGTTTKDLATVRDAFRAWRQAEQRATELQNSITNKEDRASLLGYQLEELSGLQLQPGEFQATEARFKRLSQSQKIQDAVAGALTALAEADDVRRVARSLKELDDDHQDLRSANELLGSALSLLDDAVGELRNYEAALDSHPAEFSNVEQRLAQLHDAARKHRVQPEQLSSHIGALQQELDTLSTDRSELTNLTEIAKDQQQRFRKAATKVSKQRLKAAKGFGKAISATMNTLGIQGGELSVELNPSESEYGLEDVNFLVVTNPKYPAAPLNKVASGGEQARISLAIAIEAAGKTKLPCLVLDEADVGVGGTTADVVGRLLRNLGQHTQVLCVTHAPQVAALGEHHLRVHKDEAQDTQIQTLAKKRRIEELARMLAGSDVTAKTRAYARTLLDEAT